MRLAQPRSFQWTRSEYYRLAETEMFQDRRVELLEGEIIEMPPQKNEHVVAVKLVEKELEALFGPRYFVRVQSPLDLGEESQPEPDVAVVTGSPRDYKSHPTTALLVVEISDSSLRLDRQRKRPIYARAGIADYWILNLIDRCLEVHRRPIADSSIKGGFRFGETTILTKRNFIAPLAMPKKRIVISDLLP